MTIRKDIYGGLEINKICAIIRNFIFCIILFGIVLLPMVYTIFYSIPSADDFSMANGCSKNKLVLDSIERANDYYMNWSGLWPYMFIETLANPLLLFPLEGRGRGVEMVFLFLSFIASIIWAINIAAKKIFNIDNPNRRCYFASAVLFVFLNTNIYNEVFYWFVGSSYMMALTLGFVTLGLTIEFFLNEKVNRGGVILLLLSGALACNFFQAAILPGMAYIMLWCWSGIREKRILWKKMIPFLVMFMSGLVAVLAPGNYVRHAGMDLSLNISKACMDAGRMAIIILRHLIEQPLVIALMIFCVYFGIRFTEKIVNGKFLVLVFILCSLTLYLNCFPIALGYANAVMANRLYFLLDSTALIGMVISCICLGMYVKSLPWYKEIGGNSVLLKLSVIGSICLLLYSTVVCNQNINNLPWFQTLHNISEVKLIHDSWIECLVTIRDAEEDKVELEMSRETYSSPILRTPGISEDDENWINIAIAGYFGKKSVVVRIK